MHGQNHIKLRHFLMPVLEAWIHMSTTLRVNL